MATEAQVKALKLALDLGPWKTQIGLMDAALPARPGVFNSLTDEDAVITIKYANKVLSQNGLPIVKYDEQWDRVLSDPNDHPGHCVDLWEDRPKFYFKDLDDALELPDGEIKEVSVSQTLEEVVYDSPPGVNIYMEVDETPQPKKGFVEFRRPKNDENFARFTDNVDEEPQTQWQTETFRLRSEAKSVSTGWVKSGNTVELKASSEPPQLSDDAEKLNRLRRMYDAEEYKQARRSSRARDLVAKIKKGRMS